MRHSVTQAVDDVTRTSRSSDAVIDVTAERLMRVKRVGAPEVHLRAMLANNVSTNRGRLMRERIADNDMKDIC
jgi:hypothetical protein